MVKTLLTGTRFRECEHHCLMTSECVSVNIGPIIHSGHKVTCELSNSDDIQHPEDLIIRPGWDIWSHRGRKKYMFSVFYIWYLLNLIVLIKF